MREKKNIKSKTTDERCGKWEKIVENVSQENGKTYDNHCALRNACMAEKSTHNLENILDEFIDIAAAYTGSAMNFDLRAIICKEKRK